MRGKDIRSIYGTQQFRITPAYAGKRQRMSSFLLQWQDHPRLCGEKIPAVECSNRPLGSPPPMRGKELFPVVSVRRLRITPAYAGKSSGGYDLCPVHAGSPPPMRGKVSGISLRSYESRITPAYAGKSTFSQAYTDAKIGSPPPMRGKERKLKYDRF